MILICKNVRLIDSVQKQSFGGVWKKIVLKTFAKLKGKHLCRSLFNKIVGVLLITLSKKSLRHRCVLVNFAKFVRTAFSIEHFRWLREFNHISALSLKTTWFVFSLRRLISQIYEQLEHFHLLYFQ